MNEFRYIKVAASGTTGPGYEVYEQGIYLGKVIATWKVLYGNCWVISMVHEPGLAFPTRREAARYLRYLRVESMEVAG